MPQRPPEPRPLPPKRLDPEAGAWSLIGDEALETRSGRSRLVLAIAAFFAFWAAWVAAAVHGYDVEAVAVLLVTIAAWVVWWVLSGQKGDPRRKLPRASYGGIDFPLRAADWREARLRSQLAGREMLLAAERMKDDPDVLWVAELVGSVNALSWALGEPTREKLTEQELEAVRRFVPVGGAR